jgi:hypothetical protein
MSLVVEDDILANPVHVGVFSFEAVVTYADLVPDLLEQFWHSCRLRFCRIIRPGSGTARLYTEIEN